MQYLIDVGDSTSGPVGLVIRVTADSPQQALARVRAELPDALEERTKHCLVRFYANALALKPSDVEDE